VNTERCANCEAELHGEWCHACGQRDTDLKMAIWRLLADLLAETFEADGRLARTLPMFFLRPGQLVRDYVDGRRKRYTSPVRLLVFSLAMGFLLLGVRAGWQISEAEHLESEQFEVVDGKVDLTLNDQVSFTIDAEPGSAVETRLHALDGMNERQAVSALLNAWLDAAPGMVLLMVPLFAFLLEVLYPKFLVIEHLLLSMLLHAQGLLLLSLAAMADMRAIDAAVVLWLFGQVYASMLHVYQQSWRRTLFKYMLLLPATFIAFAIAAIGAMVIGIFAL
jgi:hypothetical protein